MSRHSDITTLTSVAELDALAAESATRPVLVLKHSYSCGTSAQALDELETLLDAGGADGARVAMVTVQSHRDVSNEIARRFGIRHETPQALLLRDGRSVWHASHFRVTAEALARAIAGHVPTVPAR